MTEEDFWTRLDEVTRCRFIEDYEAALFDVFKAGNDAQRSELRTLFRNGSLPRPKEWKNPTDYERSDLNRLQKVERCLTLFALRGLGDDYRDDLMSIGWAHCGAEVLGLDVAQLFERYAALCEPAAAVFLLKFLARKPEDKSLKAWRLRIIQTPEGPWIENTF